MVFLLYPVFLVKFWYVDATLFFLNVFKNNLNYCINLFSLPLLIQTFFKPVKNEYRKDLILFSIFFGMAVKSFLIGFSLCVIVLLLAIEVVFLILFWAFPYLLYQLLSL